MIAAGLAALAVPAAFVAGHLNLLARIRRIVRRTDKETIMSVVQPTAGATPPIASPSLSAVNVAGEIVLDTSKFVLPMLAGGTASAGPEAPTTDDPVAYLQALQAARAARSQAKAGLDAAEAALAKLAGGWQQIVTDIQADLGAVGGIAEKVAEEVKSIL